MRIVIYNFVQPGDPTSKQGGGVAIYKGNLIQALRADGHEVIALSCGDRYSLRPSRPYLIDSDDGFKRAVIVNSPVMAPAHFAFHHIERYFQDSGLDHIPAQLKAKYGRVDVFHFQNTEGLTTGFFQALRREFPLSRILVTAHNYNLVCPQVNLWYREHKTCTDYRDGRSCVNCLTFSDLQPAALNQRRMETILTSLHVAPGSRPAAAIEWFLRAPFEARRRLLRHLPARKTLTTRSVPIVVTSDEKSAKYRRYREANIELVQNVVDHVIAVSARTKHVLVDRGLPAEKISVCYIGTAHYTKFLEPSKIRDAHGHIHMAYLGYMRTDKGFYFFLEALFALSEEWAKNVSVTIAAPLWDFHLVERLRGMAYKYRNIRVIDGYTHKTLDAVLEGVNLGVVPVLWEDNLPQVAIEMAARGIPLLTSGRGGAQEIGNNPEFVFRAGSKRDFCVKLQRLISGEVSLGAFWSGPTTIKSMAEHTAELMYYYERTRL